MKKGKRNYAIRKIIFVTSAALLLIVADVFSVSIIKTHFGSGTDLSVYADNANIVTETTQALRGNIYDRSGNVIAQDNRTYNIICILNENRMNGKLPAYVVDKEDTAAKLSKILMMDEQKILDYLNQKSYQTELGNGGRNLSKNVKDEIEALGLPGIEFTNSIQRIYPNGTFASNLIGYAQSNDTGTTVGQMGLELYLDSYLTGTNGSRVYQVDKNGHVLPGMLEETVSAINGDNVYLTLDANIQLTLEESFMATKQMFDAKRAWGGVMEIGTGKVVAWGQTPSFDPNTLENITDYTNIGAEVPYEPGSTLKSFTWAAAMNEGTYDGNAYADGDEYCYSADRNNNPVKTSRENAYGCIYNAGNRKYGSVTLDYGLMKSLNTVAGIVQNQYISSDVHLEYLKKFGFFDTVDTDGLPEEAGYLNFTWPADKLALSYGQGSTVTMLQLFQAYSAIFGDGNMVKPYFVESIRDPYDSSNIIYQGETQVVGTPITEDTARSMQKLLWKVVNDDEGSASYYRIPECEIIGKTGTTQFATSESGYETGETIVSFMCALPADNPQVLVYYAFQAEYDRMAHAKTEPVTSLIRKVAQTYSFASGSSSAESAQTTETIVSTMPGLINHTVEYAKDKLAATGANVFVLGDGETVVNQYPNMSDTIYSNDKIFLLTNNEAWIMPDLTGWTRNEVASLWAATGNLFALNGNGTVVSQNIAAGTVVNKGTIVEVTFSETGGSE